VRKKLTWKEKRAFAKTARRLRRQQKQRKKLLGELGEAVENTGKKHGK
jgi:hypothetical protein